MQAISSLDPLVLSWLVVSFQCGICFSQRPLIFSYSVACMIVIMRCWINSVLKHAETIGHKPPKKCGSNPSRWLDSGQLLPLVLSQETCLPSGDLEMPANV
jgi:hypothetical protein